jgi:hypothetical protein
VLGASERLRLQHHPIEHGTDNVAAAGIYPAEMALFWHFRHL